MTLAHIKNIEKINYLLAAAVSIVSLFLLPTDWFLGITVGAALCCVNFSLLRWLIGKWMSSAPKSRGMVQLLIIPKMAGLLVAIALCGLFLPISVLGLAIGFSIFLVSIATEMVRLILQPPSASEATGTPGSNAASNAAITSPGDSTGKDN